MLNMTQSINRDNNWRAEMKKDDLRARMEKSHKNRLGPARGFVIGFGLAAAFWIAFVIALGYLMSVA
jgi:hypothetical protein